MRQWLRLWVPVIVLLLLTLIILLAGLEEWLEYNRTAIQQGEWWRLLTCNLVHLGWGHWFLNSAGLVLICALFGAFVSLSRWLIVFLITGLFVSVGVYLFNPEVEWYVGLSGVLHGLFLVGAAAQLKRPEYRDWLSVTVVTLFIAKLVWEQFMGPLPGSESAAGGDVIVEAHFYGAVGGLVWLLWDVLASQWQQRQI